MADYKEPTIAQMNAMQNAGALINNLLDVLLSYGKTREIALAITKAEECLMWFNQAVMRSGESAQENSFDSAK